MIKIFTSAYMYLFTRQVLHWQAADYGLWVTYKNLLATLAPVAALLVNSCAIAIRAMLSKYVAADELVQTTSLPSLTSPNYIINVTQSPNYINTVTQSPNYINTVTQSPNYIITVTQSPNYIITVTQSPNYTITVTQSPNYINTVTHESKLHHYRHSRVQTTSIPSLMSPNYIITVTHRVQTTSLTVTQSSPVQNYIVPSLKSPNYIITVTQSPLMSPNYINTVTHESNHIVPSSGQTTSLTSLNSPKTSIEIS
ncbi:hypothetical protein Hamer_G014441, partial [Homarus americanus]